MRIFIITKTNDLWSDRIINNIYKRGPKSWVYKIYRYQTIPPLEVLLDEREKYLPTKIPECDLILPLGLPADLVLLLPLIAKKSGAKAAIIPIDRFSQNHFARLDHISETSLLTNLRSTSATRLLK